MIEAEDEAQSKSLSVNNVDDHAIPYKIVAPLCLLQIVEAFNGTSIFSYIGFMILDFKMVDDENKVGFYAGFLGSSFYVGQLFSSFVWGVLSDRIGKRKTGCLCVPSFFFSEKNTGRVLLAGACGTLFFCLAFGFAFNFWFAMVIRFLGGLLNGNIGVVKVRWIGW